MDKRIEGELTKVQNLLTTISVLVLLLASEKLMVLCDALWVEL